MVTILPRSPAVFLRKAASAMKIQAQRASTGERWESEKHYDSLYLVDLKPSLGPIDFHDPVSNSLGTDDCSPFENPRSFLVGRDQADHIAGMHPLVVLALAALLEATATDADVDLVHDRPEGPCCEPPAACHGHDPVWFCGRCSGELGVECHCWDKVLAVAEEYLGQTWKGSIDARQDTAGEVSR
jgi:hypothetical protein